MLVGINEQLDGIKLHAQDIGNEVDLQAKLIAKVNVHVDHARDGLELQNSELSDLLGQYRTSGKLWKDMCLCVTLMILVGLNVYLLKWKGVF